MTILVTGVAGFIGAQVAEALLARGEQVTGVDNLNAYYSPALKAARLSRLENHSGFSFRKLDLASPGALDDIADPADITHILHFAAQAGVRFSMDAPRAFIQSNLTGHLEVLEYARRLPALKHLVYASSSSVYGRNTDMPFRETDRTDLPGSFYAVTKRSAELMSESHAHLYGLPQTGLRFFTVYGPWGRPDMACFRFAEAIADRRPVPLYSGEGLQRDFTYIADVVQAVLGVMDQIPAVHQARVLNVGYGKPALVSRFLELLGQELGEEPLVELRERPAADVIATWASTEALRTLTGWTPETGPEAGIAQFVKWFRQWRTDHPPE
ncbi:NAD-dependent epimerase/dehydratase family protein [Acetobacter sp. AN02]|uniref:NAD-dependent epimerase/dehydratase family protein n=1 Tax=Acetobacter sp. AN02 TaxID=2894186 RepID=UPI002434478D|nr:NAD-dependent epimerase/dehydratase family protein [Acetobacter sp. AN02]MDG6095655.1 NAD-dependent epimerase/dehydratase family protein [Acetobacter sp. AN02]